MSKKEQYKAHWSSGQVEEDFVGFKKFISDAERDVIRQMAERIMSQLNTGSISVLDIGPGEGSLSLRLLALLSDDIAINSYTGVEISESMVSRLQSKEEEFNDKVGQVEFVHGDAETMSFSVEFDLIVSLNSWYGLSPQSTQKLQNKLTSNGLLAILLSSRDSVTVDLTERFKEPMFAAEDLERWLKESDTEYEKHQLSSDKLNKQDFLEQDKGREGFLNYLLRSDFHINKVETYLQSKPEKYFDLPHTLFFIRRSA